MKRFSIDFSFVILLGIIALSPKQDILLKLIAALFLHELGHLFWIGIFHLRIESLKLSIFGFFLKLEGAKSKIVQDVLIYSGGILVNLFCFLFIPDPVFKKINLLLLCFNILPVYPLDGFQAIRSILSYFFPYRIILKITAVFSMITSIILLGISFLLKLDVFIILNAIYLIFLSGDYVLKVEIIFQRLLLQKEIYPYQYPLKRICFPKNIKNSFYKYHEIEVQLGKKKISEKELLSSKKLLN